MNINENIGVWKGCEVNELIAIIITSFLVPFVIFMFFMSLILSLLLSTSLMIISIFKVSNYLQKIKRNKPKNFYQKKIALLVKSIKNFKQYNTYSRL